MGVLWAKTVKAILDHLNTDPEQWYSILHLNHLSQFSHIQVREKRYWERKRWNPPRIQYLHKILPAGIEFLKHYKPPATLKQRLCEYVSTNPGRTRAEIQDHFDGSRVNLADFIARWFIR